jgi:alpha-tubulin suppressor-like RCC1 family protein
MATNPSGATLLGTTSATTVDGVATFPGLKLDRPGAGYTVTATAAGMTPATSAPFAIHITFTTMSAGAANACGLTTTGATYCWGSNSNGQLGNGDTTKTNVSIPVLVGAGQLPVSFTQLSVSAFYACGLTAGGAAYCWGLNAYGELGIGTSTGPRDCSPGFSCSALPMAVLGGLTFAAIGSGGPSCGMTSGGEVYCWGLNNVGQLGGGMPHGINSTTPVLLTGAPSIVAVAVGGGHSCGLTTAHAAYCWGDLGTGDTVAGGFAFATIYAGQNHTCGLTSTGAAYCWGGNGRGEIGDGSSADRSTPVAVVGGFTFVTLTGGWEHTCGITPTGAAYCWGTNAHGELGIGTAGNNSYTPIAAAQGFTFSAISAGRSHTCGLTPGGAVYCWGSNDVGELGNGGTASSSVPTPVVQ